jgi:deoxyribose-phosphate aldolase
VLQKQEEEENSQQDNEKQNNTTSILQEADFIKTSTGDYMIPSPINKEKTITITLKEKELIQKSPEAEKNLIDFIKVTDEN